VRKPGTTSPDSPGHPRLTPPTKDVLIKEWFEGHYETVYLILHPVLKIDPKHREIWSENRRPSREELRSWVRPWNWGTVVELAGLAHRGELNRLFLMSIGAIRKTQPEALDHLTRTMAEKHLVIPDEGDFPGVLLDDYLASFLDLGHRRVSVGNELGTQQAVHDVAELASKAYPYVGEAHPTLYSEDRSVLYCVHWDSFYTFLCGAREPIQRMVSKYAFEGFYAGPDTKVYWYEEP
jgi:hypothetical protein